MTPDEPAEAALAREHQGDAASVLARALATLRRAAGGRDAGRLRLPADLLPFPPDLWAPLSVIHQLDARRAAVDDGRLANALRRIARWCAAQGARETALAFAEASAALHPHLPSPALLAAWSAFEAGRAAQAHRWLAEAIARSALAQSAGAAHASTDARRRWGALDAAGDERASIRRAAVA